MRSKESISKQALWDGDHGTAYRSCSISVNSPNPTVSPLTCNFCASAEESRTAPQYG